MKLIKPIAKIESIVDSKEILKAIERAGRTCYKSEGKITDDSAAKFVQMIIKAGHESVLEHISISTRVICDRGVSHEIVRHRLCSYSQESTRYCDYTKDKFENQITFIIPPWCTQVTEGTYVRPQYTFENVTDVPTLFWLNACLESEETYEALLIKGWQPQQARTILPNSLKTELIWTANLREWRTIFKQRTSKRAHPQMREIMIPLLAEFKEKIPSVFDDIVVE